MSSPRTSIWPSDAPLPTSHSQSFSISIGNNINSTQDNINIRSIDALESRKEELRKAGSPIWVCVRCFIIGSLLVGVPLAVILTVWLTSSSYRTTTTSKALSMTTLSRTSTASTATSATATTSIISPCAPTSVNSASTLYTTTSGNHTSYTCFAYAWTSPVTGNVTLAFQLRHDPDYWYLDDVSVTHNASQMLNNGGFETGSLPPWIRTTPNGICASSPAQVSSTISPHSGTYYVSDGSNGCADQISQQFTVISGEVYFVSFWLKSGATGSGISAQVTLS